MSKPMSKELARHRTRNEEKKKGAENRDNVEVHVEVPPSVPKQNSAQKLRDGARAFVGIFVEFPSYFDIPINSTLCLAFQFVQKFRGQSEAQHFKVLS